MPPDETRSKTARTDEELSELVDKALEEFSVEEGSPAWMTTFGDMMSLLLAFFILLFSLSEIKLDKFMQASESLRQGFGQSEIEMIDSQMQGAFADSDTPNEVTLESLVDEYLEEILQKLIEFIQENNLEQNLRVSKSELGVTLRIQDVVLFNQGSANINESSSWIVERLAHLVLEIDLPVVVSGHTDDCPICTDKFPSNWELSTARASGVARVFIAQSFDPRKVHVEGYAEFLPVDTNDTVEGRAANRRVELLYTRLNVVESLVGLREETTVKVNNGQVQDSTVETGAPVKKTQ